MQRQQLIDNFHRRLIESNDNGKGFYLSGWSSQTSQSDRFAILLKTSHFTGGSVVDYGCGSGDLYQYIRSLGVPFSYVGFDQNQSMIDIAKARYGNMFKRVDLDEVDFGMADFVFASGIFQFRDPETPSYHIPLIRKLFLSCRYSLGVNLLSALRHDTNKVMNEMYFWPSDVVTFAQSISNFWILDHSYHAGQGDMTLGLHRKKIQEEWRRPNSDCP